MPDIRGLLGDPEFRALPQERQKALLARIDPALAEEFAASVAPPVTDPTIGASPADSRLDPERMSFRGASSMMTSEPQRTEMTPLEGAVTAAGGSTALAALTGGAGALPGAVGRVAAPALRFAATPKGGAIIEGTREALSGGSPADIAGAALVGAGGGAGLGAIAKHVPLPKFLKAKLAHTLARGAKVAAEEAAPAAKTAVKEAVKAATPTVEDVSARALKLIETKLSPGQIAEVLRSEFAPGQRGIGVGYFRKLTDQLIAHAAKGAK